MNQPPPPDGPMLAPPAPMFHNLGKKSSGKVTMAVIATLIVVYIVGTISASGAMNDSTSEQEVRLERLESTWDEFTIDDRVRFCFEYKAFPERVTADLIETGLERSTLIEFLTGKCI